ncbi:D-glycero-alpha-D-manno-heptose-1,7-bisphosphate 7-phosphatase [Noviherbaspirillum malthae]|jgi:histidinol-phosphate phosphatase family protein|uniref:D-glycero-alpha-D-manno-heptose-1,7-bisphosphate 7-phosphatase n=1 Tax=Noviherbaspirillum malthae TaxID=1260987 RepID=UPI00188F38D3|nr:HAD family hydrolase [Noviherbaspirillum malthae]
MTTSTTSKRAIFLDKDGTLVEDVPYNVNPELIALTWQAGQALQILQELGFVLIVVTNQSGVARGLFTEAALGPVHQRLSDLLAQYGVVLDGFHYCPHHPEGVIGRYAVPCTCRKPMPGMLLRAASELEIDLSRSWMIGDILHDVEAGRRAGCQTVLIDNGNETEWKVSPLRTPHFSAPDLYTAATMIAAVEKEGIAGGEAASQ